MTFCAEFQYNAQMSKIIEDYQISPVTLDSLLGVHELSGVDINNIRVKNTYSEDFEDAECISFMLDGRTYTAIEDPDDGYRSTMKEIGVSDVQLENRFPGVEVNIVWAENTDDETNNYLQFIDVETQKVVLEVGTENTDDYYPCYVAHFFPENMSHNSAKQKRIKRNLAEINELLGLKK